KPTVRAGIRHRCMSVFTERLGVIGLLGSRGCRSLSVAFLFCLYQHRVRLGLCLREYQRGALRSYRSGLHRDGQRLAVRLCNDFRRSLLRHIPDFYRKRLRRVIALDEALAILIEVDRYGLGRVDQAVLERKGYRDACTDWFDPEP